MARLIQSPARGLKLKFSSSNCIERNNPNCSIGISSIIICLMSESERKEFLERKNDLISFDRLVECCF